MRPPLCRTSEERDGDTAARLCEREEDTGFWVCERDRRVTFRRMRDMVTHLPNYVTISRILCPAACSHDVKHDVTTPVNYYYVCVDFSRMYSEYIIHLGDYCYF
ncbi:hypothetical protein J6590_039980 [Homalodisca vitripennis]|nr:hypothetical protein J6590_039980 [Homalodisca vitripennis]